MATVPRALLFVTKPDGCFPLRRARETESPHGAKLFSTGSVAVLLLTVCVDLCTKGRPQTYAGQLKRCQKMARIAIVSDVGAKTYASLSACRKDALK